MKIKKRLNISDWEIIEDTPKLKRFGDGGSVEKNKKILKEKGILPEQEFKRNKYQESLSNNLKPIGYDYNSFVHALYEKNKGREVLENRAKDTDPYASNLIPKSRLDAFNFYMGKPQKYNTFDVSDYRPSKEADFKTNYYKLNYFQDYYAPDSNVTDLENLFKTKSLAEIDLPFLFSKKEKQKVNAADAPVMANYTLSKGEDEKGKYYSYYDKWDIAPMDFGKPFEIYDRIYYDPSTNKIIPPKKPYIKKAPLPGQSVQDLEFKNGGSIKKYPNGGDLKNAYSITADALSLFPPTSGLGYVMGLPTTAYDMYEDYQKGDIKQMGLDAMGLIPAFKLMKYSKFAKSATQGINMASKFNKAVDVANMANDVNQTIEKKEFGGNITKESEWELVNETNKKLPKRRLNLNKSSDWEIVD